MHKGQILHLAFLTFLSYKFKVQSVLKFIFSLPLMIGHLSFLIFWLSLHSSVFCGSLSELSTKRQQGERF